MNFSHTRTALTTTGVHHRRQIKESKEGSHVEVLLYLNSTCGVRHISVSIKPLTLCEFVIPWEKRFDQAYMTYLNTSLREQKLLDNIFKKELLVCAIAND